MEGAKFVVTPTSSRFKEVDIAKDKEEAEHMDKVPYACVVGSLMYAMTIGSRPDLGYDIYLIRPDLSGSGCCRKYELDGDIIGTKQSIVNQFILSFPQDIVLIRRDHTIHCDCGWRHDRGSVDVSCYVVAID